MSTKRTRKGDRILSVEGLEDRRMMAGFTYQPAPPPAIHAQPFTTTAAAWLGNLFTKPWYGNYGGPENLGYHKAPINVIDAGFRSHDIAYRDSGASNTYTGLINPLLGRADLALAQHSWSAAIDFSNNLSAYDRLWGAAAGTWFGLVAGAKGKLNPHFIEPPHFNNAIDVGAYWTNYAHSNATREQNHTFDVNFNPWLNTPRNLPYNGARLNAVDSVFEMYGKLPPSNYPSFFGTGQPRQSQVTLSPIPHASSPFSFGSVLTQRPSGSYTIPPSIPGQWR
jgi:hypothetical protein